MTYQLKTLNTLKPGQKFMFSTGSTINIVVICQRDLLVYTNLLTMKTRRMKLLSGKGNGIWPLRYAKDLDGFFDRWYESRKEIEAMPF